MKLKLVKAFPNGNTLILLLKSFLDFSCFLDIWRYSVVTFYFVLAIFPYTLRNGSHIYCTMRNASHIYIVLINMDRLITCWTYIWAAWFVESPHPMNFGGTTLFLLLILIISLWWMRREKMLDHPIPQTKYPNSDLQFAWCGIVKLILINARWLIPMYNKLNTNII
jgi:hypothetical protein